MRVIHKGALLCLLAAALIASANVVSKEVMGALPYLMVGFCWYFFPWLWFTISALWRKQRPFHCLLQHWKVGALLGSTNYLAGLAWIYAIYQIGPSTTGFFQRIETVVFFLLGVLFLRERITLADVGSMFLAFIGALLLTFSLERIFWIGALAAVLSACASGTHNYLAKVYVRGVTPHALGTLRTFYTTLLFFPTVLLAGQFQIPNIPQLGLLSLGTILSPFLGYLSLFISLKSLTASRAAIILTIGPFFVVLYAWLLFSTVPSMLQWFGGLLIIAGVLLPFLHKAQKAP